MSDLVIVTCNDCGCHLLIPSPTGQVWEHYGSDGRFRKRVCARCMREPRRVRCDLEVIDARRDALAARRLV